MTTDKINEQISTSATEAFSQQTEQSGAEGLTLELQAEAPPHPRFPTVATTYAAFAGDTLQVFTNSFEALAAVEGLDLEEEVGSFVATVIEDRMLGLAGLAPADKDDTTLARHARFRQGDDLPYAWYRGGDLLDDHTWAVDLDVFTEVWITRADWEKLVAGPAPLHLGEDVLDLELPEDADPTEWLTLEGAGLFDDDIVEDEPLPKTGDLHLLFFVL